MSIDEVVFILVPHKFSHECSLLVRDLKESKKSGNVSFRVRLDDESLLLGLVRRKITKKKMLGRTSSVVGWASPWYLELSVYIILIENTLLECIIPSY